MPLPAGSRRCPEAASQAAFSVSRHTSETGVHPQCPGIPAVHCTPKRVGALGPGLPDPVKVDNSEGKQVKTAKPQHRLKSNKAGLN